MRIVLRGIFVTFVLAIVFCIPVCAATYQANSIEGKRLKSGDVIEFGSGRFISSEEDINGTYEINIAYTEVYFSAILGKEGTTTESTNRIAAGETWIVPRDLTAVLNSWGPNLSFSLYDINTEIFSEYRRNGVERIRARCYGGVEPYTYRWNITSKSGKTYSDETWPDAAIPCMNSIIETNNPYIDIDYSDIIAVHLRVFDSDNEDITLCGAGFSRTLFIKQDSKESSEDDYTEEETNNSETPQTPSTLPNGTVQISIGSNNKSFANTKVLNQFLYDSINQKLIADLYAKDRHKTADILMQKNIYPPHGVNYGWKNTSHTIRWKDLNIKNGDTVMIVWYTPQFLGHKANLQMISATVIEDGTIEFTIPRLGDVSVMSIVKLK